MVNQGEKHFLNTQHQNQLISRQQNHSYYMRFDTGDFSVMQLEQLGFQNWYSNISFGADFSYSVGGVTTSLLLDPIYYDRDTLELLLSNAGFDLTLYSTIQFNYEYISRSAAWKPIGLAWVHMGFSLEKLQKGLYTEAVNQVPEGPLNLQYGSFYMAIDGLLADQGYTFMLPVFGGYGDMVYIQKQEGMYTVNSSVNRLVNIRIRLYDRFGQLLRSQFDNYPVLWQLQFKTIKI